jgi:hypothetical protein
LKEPGVHAAHNERERKESVRALEQYEKNHLRLKNLEIKNVVSRNDIYD